MAKKNPGAPATPPRRRSTGTAPRRTTAAGATAPNPADAHSAPDSSSVHGQRNPTNEEIAEAAYHRYLSRGGRDGADFDDWLEAERELKTRKTR
jgi:hypothetical protein